MDNFSADNLDVLRPGIFIGMLMLMICLERLLPRRKLDYPVLHRWRTNLSMIVIATVAVRLLLPITTIGMATIVNEWDWGLFLILDWPVMVELIVAILLLDFGIYLQHVASHHFSILWRFHQVHHADPDFDATTGIRFHPVEILLSMLFKFILIILLGPSVLAVILFEIVLNATAVFNHANVRIPLRFDRLIRLLIVTPDVHRIHHSVIRNERDSNYGFNLTVWDRLCGTWMEQPQYPHSSMKIGLDNYPGNDPTILRWGLMLPFRHRVAEN
jgi:sterol desaturase/sphingolipid hydroxylase (fatty acid hydroxylase superfamily)